jgi:hypothetical protein
VTATPGPWGVEQTDDTNWVGPLRRSGDGKVFGVVCSTDREGLQPNVRRRHDANARLIAAAPELRQALLEVVGDSYALEAYTPVCRFCARPEGESHDPECTLQIVLAALAKADGQAVPA